VNEIQAKITEHTLEVCAGRVLVFVDGIYRQELSDKSQISGKEAWKVGSLVTDFPEGSPERAELLEEIIWAPEVGMRHTLAAGSLSFTSLNQACLRDAACLYVPEKVDMDAPVQFIFVSTTGTQSEDARISHPRLAVIAHKRSTAKIVQSYIDIGPGVSMTNACTSIKCARRAEIQHLHANELGSKGQLFDSVSVGTKKLSIYKNVFINVGGEMGRVNFQATMNGTMGRVETEGLTVTGEEQELDIHSFIHHLRKGGVSNMYQCNIVSGESHCVFKGRMKLEPRAREVKADQLIRSIMLTDACTVDAMPTLEVCSGDVDCTHGATVADIDENEAFYLQSRGECVCFYVCVCVR
jgi:Fe-S cluster assembly protein SufD